DARSSLIDEPPDTRKSQLTVRSKESTTAAFWLCMKAKVENTNATPVIIAPTVADVRRGERIIESTARAPADPATRSAAGRSNLAIQHESPGSISTMPEKMNAK